MVSMQCAMYSLNPVTSCGNSTSLVTSKDSLYAWGRDSSVNFLVSSSEASTRAGLRLNFHEWSSKRLLQHRRNISEAGVSPPYALRVRSRERRSTQKCDVSAELTTNTETLADMDSVSPAKSLPDTAKAGKDGNLRETRRKTDWAKAQDRLAKGGLYQGRVEAVNGGGLVVRCGSLQAFLPLSQLDPARVQRDPSKSAAEVARKMVGSTISAKVIEANEVEGRLVLSEKQAVWRKRLVQLQEGKTFDGRVSSITDFGAFVDLKFSDGTFPVSGLVHLSELSWDPVQDARDVLSVGDEVRVKVILVDKEKLRVALSIKALQEDPLLQTLDTLMPANSQGLVAGRASGDADAALLEAELLNSPLPGLEQICTELLQEDGIVEVKLGRQAVEKRVVSQDLELWLSNALGEGGNFTLLARAGRQVQEVHVTTTGEREGLKAAVQRVTGRVP